MRDVAIVTGASQGIGAAIAQRIARRDRAVVITYRSHEDEANALAVKLSRVAADAVAMRLDVRNRENVNSVIDAIKRRYGRLNILVNNAGITADKTVVNMSEQEWRDVIDVNLSGTFYCCKAAVPLMRSSESGRIVNITSAASHLALHGQANYTATKAGLIGFTRVLARETAGENITVNAVSPGYISSPLLDRILPPAIQRKIAKTIPLNRLGTPMEVAEVVAFLIDHGSYITGAVIDVDGGLFG